MYSLYLFVFVGQEKFYPYEKEGGRTSFRHAEGGGGARNKCWVSFSAEACYCHRSTEGGRKKLQGGGGGGRAFLTPSYGGGGGPSP